MNFVKEIECMQLLNKLIKQERTGTPDELADRLRISRRKLYELIEKLKCWGLNIQYDRGRETFMFTEEGWVDIQFSLKVIKSGECKKISGGGHFFPSVLFSARSEFTLASQLTGCCR